MLTRKQSKELQQKKQMKQCSKLTQQHSYLNESLSTEIMENVFIEMLELLDVGNKLQVETDFQESCLDPQTKRIEDYNNCYNKEFFESLVNDQIDLTQCLLNHQIRAEIRGRMVDWMIEVFAANECINDNTFFRAVNLMDAFLKSTYNYTEQHLYLIGVTCIFIASKIEDIQSFGIKTITEDLSHNKFSSFQIKEFESIILETLNYDTNFPTVNDYLSYLRYQLFGQSQNQSVQVIHETALYILKMCYHDYQLMQNKQILLAASILGYTIQKYIQNHMSNLGAKLKKQLLQTQNNLLRIGQLDLIEYLKCLSQVEELTQYFHLKYPSCKNLIEVKMG
ncbi:unnamed protein product [Paramecium sonneborni]|uniref:Cyclin-like domain-containing protein n=1 Tax=Paramecium sonneborni TaxID=65129 RepID=A0A8S1RAX7_9CILI|nr:unnamed protein product [Paramecium sonneborni]